MSEQYPSKRAPKSMTTGSAGRMRRGPGRWWGMAALGPLATMVSNDGPLAPSLRISKSSALAKASSVQALSQLRADVVQGLVGDPGRGGQTGQLPRVLYLAKTLDEADS